MKASIAALLACALALAGSSCSKKTGVNQNLNPDNQLPVDFMPSKAGSYWKYGSRGGEAYTRYARGIDTIKNSLTYSYYERHDDSTGTITPEYFGRNGQYHFTLIDLDGSETNYLEFAYWKDSARKGDSWTNVGKINYSGAEITMVMETEQQNDGDTMSYGGYTFYPVIHVHCNAKASYAVIQDLQVGSMDMWFVKGLGIVREEADINIMSLYKNSHIDSLLNYHIVP